jgi:hypothetical protein
VSRGIPGGHHVSRLRPKGELTRAGCTPQGPPRTETGPAPQKAPVGALHVISRPREGGWSEHSGPSSRTSPRASSSHPSHCMQVNVVLHRSAKTPGPLPITLPGEDGRRDPKDDMTLTGHHGDAPLISMGDEHITQARVRRKKLQSLCPLAIPRAEIMPWRSTPLEGGPESLGLNIISTQDARIWRHRGRLGPSNTASFTRHTLSAADNRRERIPRSMIHLSRRAVCL